MISPVIRRQAVAEQGLVSRLAFVAITRLDTMLSFKCSQAPIFLHPFVREHVSLVSVAHPACSQGGRTYSNLMADRVRRLASILAEKGLIWTLEKTY